MAWHGVAVAVAVAGRHPRVPETRSPAPRCGNGGIIGSNGSNGIIGIDGIDGSNGSNGEGHCGQWSAGMFLSSGSLECMWD